MVTVECTGYRFTPKAEHDLEDIWRYSAETWSADQVDTYSNMLIRTIKTLVAMPTLARERNEFAPRCRDPSLSCTSNHLLYRCRSNRGHRDLWWPSKLAGFAGIIDA
jgi:plasmid stabilization system protein ParE